MLWLEVCGTGCDCDRVEIYDSLNSTRNPLCRLCSYANTPDIITTGPEIRVEFFSDRSTSYRGFELHWTTDVLTVPTITPTDTCGDIDDGLVRSPGHPEYPNDIECEWLIQALPGQVSSQLTPGSLNTVYIPVHSDSCTSFCIIQYCVRASKGH